MFFCVCVFVQTLFMLGALLIAMSMQLDRKGLWNLLGPVLFAILLMVVSWVSPVPAGLSVCTSWGQIDSFYLYCWSS